MRALVFHAPGDIRHETVPDPTIEAPTDVVLQVEWAALCGSDLHPYAGREPLEPGTVPGHELVGVVAEAGSEVRRFRPGERVVVPFSTSCGACFLCRLGLTARCPRGQLLGWRAAGRGLHGAQAEQVRVPLADATLLGLPAGLPIEQALLAGDVLATGLFAAEQAAVGPETTVVVIGCGPVGLMAAVACRERGAARVLAVDRLPERLQLAARFGAEPVDAASANARAAVDEATAGRGADAVVEAVGSPQASRLALDLVRPGGIIAAVGVHNEAGFAFSPGEAYDRNLTYRAGRCPARSFLEPALALIAARRHDLAALFSHRLPLAEGPRAYDLFARRLDGCTKVLLRPRGPIAVG